MQENIIDDFKPILQWLTELEARVTRIEKKMGIYRKPKKKWNDWVEKK